MSFIHSTQHVVHKLATNHLTRFVFLIAVVLATMPVMAQESSVPGVVTISEAELLDKIKGGWLGKLGGLGVGAPREFKSNRKIDEAKLNFGIDLPTRESMDDVYVAATFVSVMDEHINGPYGIFDATMTDYGTKFRNTKYQLWCANDRGRNNLRKGIVPPKSGMWAEPDRRFNLNAHDIDWQIECDWIGLMCPAMPRTASLLSHRVGHVMNYGDGVYGGHFIASMIAVAFRENDPRKIVGEAIESMPRKSLYYRIINDVIDFYDHDTEKNWRKCWQMVEDKYYQVTREQAHHPAGGNLNIAASLNGAYVAMGVLYSQGDIVKAVEIATRCGQDSDCNPANTGAIMGTVIGYQNLPERWRKSIEKNGNVKFDQSDYGFNDMVSSSTKCAHKSILQMGGGINNGVYTIRAEKPCQPPLLEVYGEAPVLNTDAAPSSQPPLPEAWTKTLTDTERECFDVEKIKARQIESSSKQKMETTPATKATSEKRQ